MKPFLKAERKLYMSETNKMFTCSHDFFYKTRLSKPADVLVGRQAGREEQTAASVRLNPRCPVHLLSRLLLTVYLRYYNRPLCGASADGVLMKGHALCM